MNSDRNLLFGILAVQAGLVTERQLIDAMNAWTLAKHRPLADLLIQAGSLTTERAQLLDALLNEHLRLHGQNTAKCLTAVSTIASLRLALGRVADGDVQESVALLTDDPNGTGPYAPPPITRSESRYRIVRPHAKGGLGEVFVAQDVEVGREVALKEIRADRSADRGSIGRFVKEAEITGQLEHPGVVPIYGLGNYGDGRPFYAMRFIHGRELKDAIAEFHRAGNPNWRSLAFRNLLGRFVDVCQAVAYAHSRGVLHRDLKPRNVMLGKYGETLVVDWGLAKVVGRDDPSNAEATVHPSSGDSAGTLSGNVLGTPSYMSPEQATGKVDELGPATDVYALGAILHTILTGKPPIAGGTVVEVLTRVKAGEVLPAPGAPKALAAIARGAMALTPSNRYPTALALATEVEHWLADEPVTAHRDPLLARAARWMRKHPAMTSGVASVGLMMMVSLSVGLAVIGGYNRRLEIAKTQIEERDLALDATNGKLTLALEAEERERKQAETNLAYAKKGNELLGSVFANLDPKEIAESGLPLQVVLRENLGMAVKELDGSAIGDPLAVADMQNTLGQSLLALGDADQAVVVLEKARDTRRTKLGTEHPNTLITMNDIALGCLAGGKPEKATR